MATTAEQLAIEEAFAQAGAAIAGLVAARGTITRPPPASLEGVYQAFEQLRQYANLGAGVHHNLITAVTSNLGRT